MPDAYSDDHVELLEILKREERASVGYESDQIYNDQINAFKRYIGENYGDEQPGRSSVHDRTVFETIEWLRPDLERVFVAGGSAATIEPWAPDTAEAAEDASDYLNHLFTEEMDGGKIVDTLAFDGLLQKRGVGAVYWADAELGEPQQVQADQMMMMQLEQQGVQILEVEPIDEASAMVTYQPIAKQANPEVKCIAPEDFRIASRSTDLDRPRYCGHIERHMKSDLKAEFPEQADLIEEFGMASDESAEIDERRQQRFWDEDEMYHQEPNASDETEEVRLWREYIYHDKDGDGYAELLEVFRLDGVILSCEPVDDNPYFSWTPIPIPHRWFGLSVYDIAEDIQKIKTTLLRGALDSVYLSVAPRQIANKNVNLSDLLTVRPGAIIRTNSTSPVNQDVTPLVTPDLSGSALQMMEAIDQQSERRTGVNRNAQGMDPDALNKTATGIKLMQNAASIRKEQIARNLGRGLEMMFRKVYRLVVKMTDGPRSIHAGKGEFKQYDPSQWPAEAKIKVHVGNGSGDRETQLGQLQMILGMQREWFANFGPNNPIVGIEQLYNTAEDILRVMGHRSADSYFADPQKVQKENPEAWQAMMQPKPDPKQQAEQQKMQMEQQKLQMGMQADQAKMQQQAELDQAKLQQQAAMDQLKTQQDAENRQMEYELRREQMQMEMDLKREQIAAELELKREQMAAELALKEQIARMGAVNGAANGGATSGVHVGGEPG
tara:strand:+ start:3300 stop:5462 length:2163 start_codon:yes stop_codon:yes gene_type:complete